MKIVTNRAWREFKGGWEVPASVLERWFDWLDDASEIADGFIHYKRTWYHISQFEHRAFEGELKGWHGVHCDSYSTGVLIRLSGDGEQYQIATFLG